MKNDSQANLTEGRTQQVASETSGGSPQCSEGVGGTHGEKKKRASTAVGDVFGKLSVISEWKVSIKNKHWECVCSCGKIVTVRQDHLRSGATASCGCFNAANTSIRSFKHGHSKNYKRAGRCSDEYLAWSNMKTRCSNPRVKSYPDYGGRGITVCERWNSFESFLSDMGRKPKHTSIERLDNSKGYSPDNCAWRNAFTQGANKRNNRFITWRGQTKIVAQWARETGLTKEVIAYRLNIGWDAEKTLTTPPANKSSETNESDRDASE